MTPDSLLNDDWNRTIERLGGAEALSTDARTTGAFSWGRKIPTPMVLLRLVLAYCLGEWGLRSTTAWAMAIGLVDISNVGLLYRLRQCGDWLALLVGHLLAMKAPTQCHGRLIRILDATAVPKAGCAAKRGNGLWRIHSASDLPSEQFGHFVLTDEHESEQLDRIPVVRGEIRSLPLRRRGPTACICSRTALPAYCKMAAISSCGRDGRVPAGNSRTARRSTCWMRFATPWMGGSINPYGSLASMVLRWRCV
jgi:hypothetical protein